MLGNGKIDIAAVRIDTRLLHGQVATAWTKQIAPNRIIVVSDGVAHDELRKTMIEQAAPPGVPANVVPISKMVEVAKDPALWRHEGVPLVRDSAGPAQVHRGRR